MEKILIATGNQGKKKELLEFAGKLPFEFVTLKDFPTCEEPEENGASFAENALIKAKFYAEKFNIPAIGEDSGLILKAFPDKFGLKTKREIEAKDDIEWLRKFLDLLENETERAATFHSAVAFYNPKTKKSADFFGTTTGTIVEFPAAPIEKGIPISAVFQPEGEIDVYSAMSKDQKNQVSHRGKACKKFADFLATGSAFL